MDTDIRKEVGNLHETLKIATESQINALELVLIGMELQKSLDDREKIGA